MKRIIASLLIALPLLFGMTAVAFAADEPFDPLDKVCSDGVPTTGKDGSTVCADKNKTDNPISGKDGILLRAASFIARLTGIASVIIMIYGGIKYVTSNGDSTSVDSAKNTILYAFIGIVISLMGQGIIYFVISRIN